MSVLPETEKVGGVLRPEDPVNGAGGGIRGLEGHAEDANGAATEEAGDVGLAFGPLSEPGKPPTRPGWWVKAGQVWRVHPAFGGWIWQWAAARKNVVWPVKFWQFFPIGDDKYRISIRAFQFFTNNFGTDNLNTWGFSVGQVNHRHLFFVGKGVGGRRLGVGWLGPWYLGRWALLKIATIGGLVAWATYHFGNA
jgi:hypothetical protein